MNQRSQAIGKLKDRYHVNAKLLPFKFHFFFMFGGFAAVLPFMTLIAKELGINATALGTGYSMIPVFTFLSNPIIGLLVDYFQNIKTFLIVLLVSSAVAYSSVLSLPPIANENAVYVRISLLNDSEPFVNISVPFERSCLKGILEEDIQCKLGFEGEIVTNNGNESGTVNLKNFINATYKATELKNSDKVVENRQWITFYAEDISLLNMRSNASLLKVIQCSPTIHQCSIEADFNSLFSAYQFWIFFTLIIIGAITSQAVMTLSSVACCEVLGEQVEDYGRQRLFGTISWGIVCPLSGLMNDIQTEKSFLSGVYLMAAFLAVDIIILCLTDIPKANVSSSMRKDLGSILSNKRIVVFSFGVAFVGVMNALISVFEFWFLEDMGASRTLLGLSVFMQCLVGEVPFLFFSGWFVYKLGHFLCFATVFAGFLLRLILYSLLKDPWLVLPVDTLHGVTFGLYHGAMASFARVKAPKGMEATLLGIFSGLYDGLGYGFGSFIGGFGLDKFGPRKTFFSASMLSLGWFLSFLTASFVFRASPKRRKSQVVPVEMGGVACNE